MKKDYRLYEYVLNKHKDEKINTTIHNLRDYNEVFIEKTPKDISEKAKEIMDIGIDIPVL